MVVGSRTTPGMVADMAAFCRERGFALQRIREYRLKRRIDGNDVCERPPRCADCDLHGFPEDRGAPGESPPKGDVLTAARIAGINATKKNAEIVPVGARL